MNESWHLVTTKTTTPTSATSNTATSNATASTGEEEVTHVFTNVRDPSQIIRSSSSASFTGKYFKAKESEHRVYGSTVVDISIPLSSFKPVLVSLSRFSQSKTPKQVFF